MDERYEPPATEFQENSKDPLLDLSSSTDSTELWLIQLPSNQPPTDLDGQQLSLKLHKDGKLGDFESPSGKSYGVVSYASQAPDATVFLSSSVESKVVGKISRRVSLLHYPEPGELEKANSNHQGRMYQGSAGSSRFKSQGSRRTTSGVSHVTMTPATSSRQRGSLFQSGGESSKHPMKRYADGSMRSQDSCGRRDVTSGSLGSHHEGKAKKRNDASVSFVKEYDSSSLVEEF